MMRFEGRADVLIRFDRVFNFGTSVQLLARMVYRISVEMMQRRSDAMKSFTTPKRLANS